MDSRYRKILGVTKIEILSYFKHKKTLKSITLQNEHLKQYQVCAKFGFTEDSCHHTKKGLTRVATTYFPSMYENLV